MSLVQNIENWKGFDLNYPFQFKKNMYPLDFQSYAVYKALSSRVFCCSLATGTGKTLISYLSWELYRDQNPNTKLLIVTNASATLQFESEYYKFIDNPNTKSSVLHPKMKKKGVSGYAKIRKSVYQDWANTGEDGLDFIVTNYSSFIRDKMDILSAIYDIQNKEYKLFVIFDEATAFKNCNPKHKTHNAVKAVSTLADKVLALTATLTKGKLEEIYGIYRGIGIPISRNKRAFENDFCIVREMMLPTVPYPIRNIVGYKNIDEFNKRIEHYSLILRKKDVSSSLPPFTTSKIRVEHNDLQYSTIRDVYNGEVKISSNENTLLDEYKEVEAITEQGYIQRTLLDPRILEDFDIKDIDPKVESPKTSEILRMLEDDFTDEKIVIYTTSKRYINILKKTIEKSKKVPEYYKKVGVISGDVSVVDREALKEEFQDFDSDLNLIILNDAGIEAINLQAGSVLIVCNLPKTGGDLVQLAGRISRLGSVHENLSLMYLLTESSQDEDEYIIIQQQLALIESVQGEQEQGLLDVEALSECEMTKKDREQILSESKARLIFNKRKKRQTYYERKTR